MGKSGVRPAQCRYCIRAANRAGVRKPASCIRATDLRAKGVGPCARRRDATPLPTCGKGVFCLLSPYLPMQLRRIIMPVCPTLRHGAVSITLALSVLLAPQGMAAHANLQATPTITVVDDHHTRIV